jgi:bacillolysin
MPAFDNLRFHVVDRPVGDESFAVRAGRSIPEAEMKFNSPEAAARYHLDRLLTRDRRPSMRGVVAPENPLLVPNLEHVRSQDLLKTDTCLVRFRQTK